MPLSNCSTGYGKLQKKSEEPVVAAQDNERAGDQGVDE